MRGSTPIRFAIVAWAASIVLCAPMARAQGRTGLDVADVAMRQLRYASTPAADGTHLPRLLALRQLRDPALEPYFEALLDSDYGPIRVHAILGLGEIATPPQIQVAHVQSLDARAQQVAIATAIDKDLIDARTRDALLAWDDLAPMARVLLSGERILAGGTLDPAPLRTIAGAGDGVSADLAALLLAQIGEPGAFETARSRLVALREVEREPGTIWVLDAARQYRVNAVIDWVEDIATDASLDIDDGMRSAALFTLLALDEARGLDAWYRALPAATRYRDRVRAGLMLLASDVRQADPYRAISGDEPIVTALRDVGVAMAAQGDVAARLIELMDLGHAASAEWAMDALKTMPDDIAIPVLEHLIAIGADDGPRRAARAARATESVTRLYGRDSERVLRALAAAEDDSVDQEILLLGLYDVRDPAVGRACAQVRRIGENRVDSLALLLEARYADAIGTFDETKRAQLIRLSVGGSALSPPLQTQAAWLVVRQAGLVQDAVEALRP